MDARERDALARRLTKTEFDKLVSEVALEICSVFRMSLRDEPNPAISRLKASRRPGDDVAVS